MAADDIDRQIFLRLLTGPARLHAQSLSKVRSWAAHQHMTQTSAHPPSASCLGGRRGGSSVSRTGEQARGEVLRLTECKSALMRELIAAKRRELEDVCAQAHMAVPPLPPLPAAGSGDDAAAVCSQARRVLGSGRGS